MTEAEILQLWAYMGQVWPEYRLPEDDVNYVARLGVWNDLLGELRQDEVRVAIVRLSAERFAPTPGQLRAECAKVRADAIGEEPLPSLEQAWHEVKSLVSSVGMYGEPQFSHPVVEWAMQGFGWKDFCQSVDPDGVLRGQFRHFYESALERFERGQVGTTRVELEYRSRALGTEPKRVLTSGSDGE